MWELDQIEIDDPSFHAVFDFECYFSNKDLPHTSSSSSLHYESEHVPASVSIASNIPNYETPKCFVSSGDSQKLIDDFIGYLLRLSNAAYKISLQKNQHVFDKLKRFTKSLGKNKGEEGELERKASWAELDGFCKLKTLKTRLKEFFRELVVVSFNGARYDINLIKRYFFTSLLKRGEQATECLKESPVDEDEVEDEEKERKKEKTSKFKFIVKKNNNYLCINTKKLKFLDICNYLTANVSYQKYLETFESKQNKFWFPYEWFTSLEKLDQRYLPPHEAFISNLRGNKNITSQEYKECQKVWKTQRMRSMKDYIIYYNNLDTGPFLEALKNQKKMYSNLGVDLLRDAISVPGLTLRILMKSVPKHIHFALFNEKNKDLYEMIKNNMCGGLAAVMLRYAEKNVTTIRTAEHGALARSCRSVLGFDANSLYLYCMMERMCVSRPVRRRKENNYRAEFADMYGQKCFLYLSYEEENRGLKFQHKFNGGEKYLGERHIPVDGYCIKVTKKGKIRLIGANFHGCLFHGCPFQDCPIIKGKKINEINGKTFEELRERTKNISLYLRKEVGIELHEMQECQFDEIVADNEELRKKILYTFPKYACLKKSGESGELTQPDIIRAIRNEKFFGLVSCDIAVPEDKKEFFKEFPPIFKNCFISRDDIGSHMKDFAEEHGFLKRPQKNLISSYFGKQILLASPLVKWYLDHGLVITDIHEIIHYEPNRCFESFGQKMINGRRLADKDPSKSLIGDLYKLLSNSCFGRSILNKLKFRDVFFTTSEEEAKEYVKSRYFEKVVEITENLYEIEMKQRQIKMDTPMIIGYMVFQYAKLRMLEFFYDCIDKYVDRRDYQFIETDTDSAYFCFSGNSLEEVIIPSKRREFFSDYYKWFPSMACRKHYKDFIEVNTRGDTWLMKYKCCQDYFQKEKRTPGLFKVECKTDGCIALNPKTYICFDQEKEDETPVTKKISTKGLSKTQNSFERDSFLNILKRKGISGGTNKGFSSDGKRILTYTQSRRGLSYFYIKRKVLDDKVSTEPLLL